MDCSGETEGLLITRLLPNRAFLIESGTPSKQEPKSKELSHENGIKWLVDDGPPKLISINFLAILCNLFTPLPVMRGDSIANQLISGRRTTQRNRTFQIQNSSGIGKAFHCLTQKFNIAVSHLRIFKEVCMRIPIARRRTSLGRTEPFESLVGLEIGREDVQLFLGVHCFVQ